MHANRTRPSVRARLLAAAVPVAAWCSLFLLSCAGTPNSAQSSTGRAEPTAPAREAVPAPATLDLSSAEAFAKSVSALVSAEIPSAKVRVIDSLTLEVKIGDQDLRVQLDRIWRFCAQARDECAGEVDGLVQALRENEPKEPKPDDLVAALRTVQYVQSVRELHAELLVEPFAGELVVVCLLDQKTRARLVTVKDLETLGLNREAAFQRAKENARRRLGGIEKLVASARAGSVGVLTRGEFYESSQLLDTAGWTELSRTRPGSLIVAVPAVDVVIFSWTGDAAAIEPLRAAVKELTAKSARPLSDGLLRFSGGKWDPI